MTDFFQFRFTKHSQTYIKYSGMVLLTVSIQTVIFEKLHDFLSNYAQCHIVCLNKKVVKCPLLVELSFFIHIFPVFQFLFSLCFTHQVAQVHAIHTGFISAVCNGHKRQSQSLHCAPPSTVFCCDLCSPCSSCMQSTHERYHKTKTKQKN